MRAFGLIAVTAALGCAAIAPALADERPLWERMGISRERYEKVTEFAGAVSAHAYFLGACERYYDRESADRVIASIIGSERDDDPAMRMVRGLWADSYAKGRLDAGKFSQARCAAAIKSGEEEIARLNASL